MTIQPSVRGHRFVRMETRCYGHMWSLMVVKCCWALSPNPAVSPGRHELAAEHTRRTFGARLRATVHAYPRSACTSCWTTSARTSATYARLGRRQQCRAGPTHRSTAPGQTASKRSSAPALLHLARAPSHRAAQWCGCGLRCLGRHRHAGVVINTSSQDYKRDFAAAVHYVPDAPISPSTSRSAPPSRRDLDSGYLIWSYTLNSGRYIAITMKPTMPPTKTIITGSRIEVSALTEAETWSS